MTNTGPIPMHGTRLLRPGMHAQAAFLGGVVCVLGAVAIVGLSAFIGWDFWIARGNPANAWMTIGFELIAFGGFAASMMHKWKVRVAAGALVLVAAGWCGYTQYEALQYEQLGRAQQAAELTPAYRAATTTLAAARQAYDAAFRATTASPSCQCPQTLAAWNSQAGVTAREAAVQTTYQALKRAETDLGSLIPAPTMEPMLMFRGVAIELVKLFGLPLFGAGLGALRWASPETTLQPPSQVSQVSHEGGNVIDLGTARDDRREVETVRRLSEQGYSLREIEYETGVSKSRAQRILKAN